VFDIWIYFGHRLDDRDLRSAATANGMECQIVKSIIRGSDRQLVNNFSETIPLPGFSGRRSSLWLHEADVSLSITNAEHSLLFFSTRDDSHSAPKSIQGLRGGIMHISKIRLRRTQAYISVPLLISPTGVQAKITPSLGPSTQSPLPTTFPFPLSLRLFVEKPAY
jgi:hypothetical protein